MTDEELSKRAGSLVAQTNGLHDDVVRVVGGYCDQRDRLRIELAAAVARANTATLNAEKMEADYEAVLDCRDARHREMELAYNEKVEELFAADEKLKSEIFWRSILFWLMALLAVIILIAGDT